ncbi:hypothetical protein LTR62_005519 [Meristemomyces frigidus]|uniref:Uncharacterized protein n=1 Tax=Meristemomyces frigidus TaxID=1508187 RepID=A0AAN7YQQ0_9PEZI|nr:hypothetical protein LTR62_005519 [Meristemomyces frigidus]
MSFSKSFEMSVNADLGARTSAGHREDCDKKAVPSTPNFEMEALDVETAHKKDCPPRFSTIFGDPSPTAAPVQASRRDFESYPAPRRTSGVRVPTAVIVVIGMILLLETTALFAFALIGLYNSFPAQLLPTHQQPAINISPNFVIGRASDVQMQTVTVISTVSSPASPSRTSISTTSSSSVDSSSSSSTSSISTSSASTEAAAALAADLLGAFHFTASSSSSITAVPGVATSTEILSEIAPPRSTISSVKLVTIDPAGSTIAPRPTVTSTLVIDAPQAPAVTSSIAARSESSASDVVVADSSPSTPASIIPSTLQTSVLSTGAPPPSTPPSAVAPASKTVSTSTSTKAAGKVCIGGSGAVQPVCF